MEAALLQISTSTSGMDEKHDQDFMASDTRKPLIIGLYGVSGSGKTFTLNSLKLHLSHKDYAYYEGSQIIDEVAPGGLRAFQAMTDQEKLHWRQEAIRKIGRAHADGRQTALVTGHYMLWSELEGYPQKLWTPADMNTYTHILYLDTPADVIADQRMGDPERNRTWISRNHLKEWQEAEKVELRQHCYNHGILFSLIPFAPARLDHLIALIAGLEKQSESANIHRVMTEVERVFANDSVYPQTILVMDADRTLTEVDTGKLFWDHAMSTKSYPSGKNPLKMLFSSALGYSYTAFNQVALLYKESFDDETFEAICTQVARETPLYPQFASLLHALSRQSRVGLLVVTCGLRQIWRQILQREGLGDKVKLIGAGRIADDLIITAEVKAAIVTRLKQTNKKVIAIGDSILDLDMFHAADRAIVLVGHESTRSKTMDQALKLAVSEQNLQAYQAILPSTASPRLNTEKLPIIQLNSSTFLDFLLQDNGTVQEELEIEAATKKQAALLLMTPMRNAEFYGPNLREAHIRVGHYLAAEFCTEVLGLETYLNQHVQGHPIDGYRLYHEEQTLIIAMMRGGEPMAFGVNSAFPKAMFLHAKHAEDVKAAHLEDCVTILLVDSVINTGKSIVDFVRHISSLHATVRIVIVTGVAQKDSIDRVRQLQQSTKYNKISLIALRISENRFTGKGTTDTGNRLFNTTNIP